MKLLTAISFGIALIAVEPAMTHGQPRCVQYSLNYIVRDERGKVMDAKQEGLQIATGWEAYDRDLVSLYDAPQTVSDAVGKLNVLSHIEWYGICHFREPIKLELTFHGKKMILIFHAEGKANILVDSLPFQQGTFAHQLSEREPNTYFYSSRGWRALDQAEELYMEGLANFRQREYEQAIDRFKRSANSKPDKQTFLMLGRSCLENKQYQEALLAFNQSLKQDPRNAWARWYIGQAYESLHHNREALYSYLEAMRIGPRDETWDADRRSIVVLSVGGAIVGLSKEMTLEAALPSFKQRIKQTPQSAWSYSMLGQLYAAYGKNQEAYDALSEALRLSPNDSTWDKNQDAYTREALARVTYPLRDANEAEAKRDIADHKYVEAAMLLEKVVRMTPKDNDALALLGEARMNLKQYDGAIVALKMSIQLKADNAFAHGILGETYLAAGKNREAADAFVEARRLAPMDQRWYEGQKRALDALKKTPND